MHSNTEALRVAIIGAGSSYTPEIIEGLAAEQAQLPVREIALHDIDAGRLDIMAAFCRRFLKRLGRDDIAITASTERQAALEGARFVVVQIRVGGNQQRILDEKIPLRYGIIGQETTGPGGMMKALRTIPVMLDIARDVERCCPDALIVNYSNPAGLLTEAVSKRSPVKIAGLCAGGLFPAWYTSRALGVPASSVHYSYFGLNHLSFAYNLTVGGRALTDDEFDRVAEVAGRGAVDAALIKRLRLIPSPYLQYFFHASRSVEKARSKLQTRGEEVLELIDEAFRQYADETLDDKPEALRKRGGGGYSEVALGIMAATWHDRDRIVIVNTPNRGAVDGLPDDAVIETPCVVNAAGIFPLREPDIPRAIWGLVAAVKNYEQLAVEAALTGSRDTALLALLAHPLAGDTDVAEPLLDELLQANKAYLPQFQW